VQLVVGLGDDGFDSVTLLVVDFEPASTGQSPANNASGRVPLSSTPFAPARRAASVRIRRPRPQPHKRL